MNKKLSPAQQTLLNAIQGKPLTYRLVSMWRGGVSISSLVDVRIGGVKTEIKVRLSTIEALANKGEVILTCVNQGSKEYTVVLPATEVEAAPEAQEAEATPEAEAPEAAQPQTKENIMNKKKKLSPAQQRAVEIIGQNPVVTDRRGCGGSVLIKYAERKYATTGIKISTIEALIRLKLVTEHPADQDGDQAIKLLTTAVAEEAAEAQEAEATPEVEATEVEAPEAQEAPEAAAETIKVVWPLRAMSKYGYAVVRVTGSAEHAAGYICYRVIDYKSASLVGLYDPATVCSYRTINEAIAAMEEFEKIDSEMPRAWRACKIRQARLGLRKSKGVQANIPTTPAPEATEAPEAKAARAESLAKTEAATRLLIDTSSDDKLHRHNLGTALLMQGKKEEAKQVFLALYDSYRRENRLQEAKQPLWEIVLACPDYAYFAYTLLGKICEELQQYPDAIAAYTDAITCIGANEDYLYGLHRAYLAMGHEAKAAEYLEQARKMADEREIAMGRCIPVPAHHEEAPALSRETADAIEQRHNVIVDVSSEMYTDNPPCSTNDYGETGWRLIPQEWIDEVTTQI